MARELMAREASAVVQASVVDLAQDGRGVAKLDGKTVFVDGALKGEVVELRIVKRRRQYDEAELVSVVSPSADRVTPRCRHFGLCGGCSLQHLSPVAQLKAKEQQLMDNFERIGQVSPGEILPPLEGPAWGYRRRARLGVKYVHKKGRVLAGFRERNKPYLADLAYCQVLSPPHGELPEKLAALTETLSIKEQLPQVELAVGDDSSALVFRVMTEPNSEDLVKLKHFGEERGVAIYLQPGGLDTVRPLVPNSAPLSYAIEGLRLEFAPIDFVQVNRDINVAMVSRALDILSPKPEDSVLDLFCGLGNFTLPLARRGRKVRGVEGDAGLIAKARANATANGIGNADFAVENLFEPKEFGEWAKERYDLVLLDPPRAGAVELLPRFAEWRPRRVVYISCHPGSLARDARILTKDLGYSLKAAGVMDMFPHTTHVESIAVFEAKR
jgi:23S rRNA (uracil1939-C5)-methyltransferase